MMTPVVLLAAIAFRETGKADHATNPVYRGVIAEGITVAGVAVKLPEPLLPDGLDAAATRLRLREIAGSDRAAEELARTSVTAPFVLKPSDIQAGSATIRRADLYFLVHASLDEVDPDQALHQSGDQPTEAGNMRFTTRVLGDPDLLARQVERLAPLAGRREWFTHETARLLDRIEVEATNRVVATRSGESWIVAARTDRGFDNPGNTTNRWATLTRQGKSEVAGPSHVFEGSISYVKITPLAHDPEALFVEAHFAFVEPRDWFQGNPILRSKLSVIAQDQIRRLRREAEKRRVAK